MGLQFVACEFDRSTGAVLVESMKMDRKWQYLLISSSLDGCFLPGSERT
jgi:hypothetical protein